MKWFKHISTSGTDQDIGDLVGIFGLKGYYLFFRTIEIMSDEFDTENPGKNTFDFRWFLDQFSRKIDKKTLLKFLEITQKKRRIYFNLNGKTIYLNCPKLKELTDEYTERMLKKKSGLNPDQIGTKNGSKSGAKEERSKKKDIKEYS